MSGMTAKVTLGVQAEIQNLKQIQQQLQTALQNVKPNTTVYNKLYKELTQVVNQITALETASSQPFTNQKGIEKFNSDFVKTSNLLKQIIQQFSDLNFDDLDLDKLDQDTVRRLNDAKNALTGLKQQLHDLDVSELTELKNSAKEVENVFAQAKIDINTDSLETAVEKVDSLIERTDNHISDLTNRLQSKKLLSSNLGSKNKELNDLNALLNLDSNDEAQRKLRATNGTFGDLFRSTGSFRNGGQTQLEDRLKELGFGVDQINDIIAAIQARGKKTAEAVAAAQKAVEEERKKTQTQQKKTNTEAMKIEADLQVEQQRRAQQEQVKQSLVTAQVDPNYVQQVKEVTEATREQTKTVVEATEALEKQGRGAQQAGEQEEKLANGLDNAGKKAEEASAELERFTAAQNNLNNIKTAIANWMGFNQIIQLSRRAVQAIINDIRELDKVMTQIAVVTSMTQKDLWAQMSTYQAIAREYAVSTKGVYEVSQIWYQQGLKTAEVMQLTVETLKMAKIANLDYKTATDYMTVAIRGFRMETEQASHIVDVYSKVAAVSASDTEELATAMSKTASSAAAVGASFENTTAFMALMIESTRESAVNIGSAMKSIISRYGELKSSPDALIDSEGEAMSFNKVETALQSVGITMHDVNGQFRDFDDVILELSSRWQTLDVNTQRYIATVMAGNRQQSRFLALVSNYDRLAELVDEAANAEDAATLQTLKTLDSLESKIQNLKNAWQGFYANLGLEEVFKAGLDFLTNIINRLNSMPKFLEKIPVAAILIISNLIRVVKGLLNELISYAVARTETLREAIRNAIKKGAQEGKQEAQGTLSNWDVYKSRFEGNSKKAVYNIAGQVANVIGVGMSAKALTIGDDQATTRAGWTVGGAALTSLGGFLTGGWIGLLASVPNLFASISSAVYDLQHAEELYLKSLDEQIEKQRQEALASKNEAKTMTQAVKKLEQLRDAQYTSNEAYEEYVEYQNTLADQYPQIVAMYDAQGNAVLDYARTYSVLIDAIQEATEKELTLKKTQALREKVSYQKTATVLSTITGPMHASSGGDLFTGTAGNYGYWALTKDVAGKILMPDESLGGYGKKIDWDKVFSNFTPDVADFIYDYLKTNKAFVDETFFKDIAGFSSNAELTGFSAMQRISKGKGTADDIAWFYDIVQRYLNAGEDIAENEKLLAELDEALADTKNIVSSYIKDLIKENNLIISGYESAISALLGKNDTFATLISSTAKGFMSDEQFAGLTEEQKTKLVQKSTDQWITIYRTLGEQGYNDLIEILSHPERYTNLSDMIAAIDATDSLAGIWSLEGIGVALGNYWTDNLEKQIKDSQEQFRASLKRSAEAAELYNNEDFDEGSIYDLLSKYAERIKGELQPFFLGFTSRFVDSGAGARSGIEELLNTIFNDEYFDLINSDEFASLTKEVDWFDRTSVEEFIKSVQDAEDGFLLILKNSGLFDSSGPFIQYLRTIGVNLNTFVNEVEETLQTQLDSATKVIEAQAKGIKSLSDARAQLESLNTLLGTNYSFEEAYEWNDALQGYILNYEIFNKLLAKKLEYSSETYTQFAEWAEEGSKVLDSVRGVEKTELNDEWFKVHKLNAMTEAFLRAWADSTEDSIDKFYEQYMESYQARLDQDQAAVRQMVAAEYFSTLVPMDKILAGETAAIANLDQIITEGLNLRYGENSELARKYEQIFKDIINGNIDESNFDDAVQLLTDLGVENPLDQVLEVQVREVNKRMDLLRKLLEGKTGDTIRLTEEEQKILGVSTANLEVNSQAFVNSVRELIQSAADALHQGQMTLEDYNKQVMQIATRGSYLDTSIPDAIGGLEKITADSIADFATAMGVELSANFKFDDIKGIKQIGNELVITSFEDFAKSISAQGMGMIEVDMGDPRVQAAIASLTDKFTDTIGKIITLIGNGLKGTLSNEDVVNLQQYYGEKLDFTTTAEGMKLTAESAAELYDWLRRTQGVQGQLAFQEYAKALKDTSSTYKDIFSTEREIARLNKEIEELGGAQANNLRAQLSLAKQIALIQMADTDSYSFMDRKLPSDFAGPTNYWASVDDMYSSLAEASTTGYLSVQDFYNMITAANEMAAAAGTEIEFLGRSLDGKAETAAKYIDEGFNALKHVDGKGLVVDLESYGVAFREGAQAMGGDFEVGMKAFAESQVALLDGLINFVETIVAMEDLSTLAGEDGILDFGELFEINDKGNAKAVQIEAWKEMPEMWATLESIKIDDEPLTKLLESTELTKEQAEQITQLLNAMSQMAKSGDWDITDISTILTSIAEGFNSVNGTIEIGDTGIVLSGGIALQYEIDPNTKEKVWLVGGERYTDQKDALLASFTQSAGDSYNAADQTFTIGGFTAKIDVNEGKITYNGKDNLYDALEAQFNTLTERGELNVDFSEYLATLGLELRDNQIVVKGDEIEEPANKVAEAGTKVTEALNTVGTWIEKGIAALGSLGTIIENWSLPGADGVEPETTTPKSHTELPPRISSVTPDQTLYDLTQAELISSYVEQITELKIQLEATEASLAHWQEVYYLLRDEALKRVDELNTKLVEQKSLTIAQQVEYENQLTALREEVAAAEASRELAWQNLQAARDKQAKLEETNDTLIAQLQQLLEKNKDSKDISDDVWQEAWETAFRAEQAAREASINGTTHEFIHAPQPWEAPEGATHPEDAWAEETDGNTEATQENTNALQDLINAMNEAFASSTWAPKDIENVDNSAFIDQFISQNRDFLSTGIPWQNVQKAITEFNPALNAVLVTFEKLGLEVAWVTGENGKLIPQVQEAGKAIEDAARRAHQGKQNLLAAGRGIQTALSYAAASMQSGLNTIVKEISDAANKISNTKITAPNIVGGNTGGINKGMATGSFGNAFAAGTLMGELGPELWVSHGHYYVAGQRGAEFVNLPDDAIVFNHLQTQRLLGNGSVSSHGTPVTNEYKATSLATGNVPHGIAKASASDTLAQLKHLRDLWQAIADASVSDLGKKAGSGGGGGGGGNDAKAFVHDLERWFSLTQEILRIERDINKEQKLRARLESDQIANGEELYKTYRNEYDALRDQINVQKELATLQKSWYDKRKNDLDSSLVSKIFTFDDNGVMKYTGANNEVPGSMGGLDILATLYRTNENGLAVNQKGEAWDAKGQLEYLLGALGVSKADLLADLAKEGRGLESGATEEDILEAWSDLVDSYKEEMTDLYDQYNENEMKIYELQSQQNEIIQKIIDNELSVEQRVLTALVDKAQKAIDDLQKSRDDLQKANEKYIQGLNDSLQKQRDMYERNESDNELNKLQRQLAILQRSGGSSSQIRSLQQQISDKLQDSYFTAQQAQIDAIKEAADLQIERLDRQIELMTETLEYQKENGLLWEEVRNIMETWEVNDIMAFLNENTAAYKSMSSLEIAGEITAAQQEVEIFKADYAEKIGSAVEKALSESSYTEPKEVETPTKTETTTTTTGTTAAAAPKSGGGGGGKGSGGGAIGAKTPAAATPAKGEIDKNAGADKYTIIFRHICDGKTFKEVSRDYAYGKIITPSAFQIVSTNYIYLRSTPSSKFTVTGSAIVLLYYKKADATKAENVSSRIKTNDNDNISKYASGGLADYTGLAMVHGSKTKPESFFDAESTAILRNDVLGSINVLDTLLTTVNRGSTLGDINSNANNLTIDKPVINITVEQIANDYDAKRAGELVYEEMVKIARKSGTRSF